MGSLRRSCRPTRLSRWLARAVEGFTQARAFQWWGTGFAQGDGETGLLHSLPQVLLGSTNIMLKCFIHDAAMSRTWTEQPRHGSC
jgi:hypothetical protein